MPKPVKGAIESHKASAGLSKKYTVQVGEDKVEVGDFNSREFKPHVKLKRWGDEAYLNVEVPEANIPVQEKSAALKGDRIGWESAKIGAGFYKNDKRNSKTKNRANKDHSFVLSQNGGFEFEIVLYEKPSSNVISLPIQSRGLKFYYQAPLTDAEKAQGILRPDEVAGSYAVYNVSKKDGRYSTGKAFQIYRPKIIDAEGKWVWGEIVIAETARGEGTLTITIDQNWLDGAAYPVIVDPEFGYTSIGSSAIPIENMLRGSVFTALEFQPASITAYLENTDAGAAHTAKYAIYKISDTNLTGQTQEVTVPAASKGWYEGSYTTSINLFAEQYALAANGSSGNILIYFDDGAPQQGFSGASNYSQAWPETIAGFSYDDKIYSIWDANPASIAITVTLDDTAPTAAITYYPDHAVKDGDFLTITATFDEAIEDSPPLKIAISGENTQAAIAMTKSTTTVYTYTHTVDAGNGTATVALSDGTDAVGNPVNPAPTNANFTVDNTAPTIQDTVFTPSVIKKGGVSVDISSTGNAANDVWFAPLNTTVFDTEGVTKTKAASGTATSILAPTSAGIYYLYVLDAAGNYSAPSTATLTVPTITLLTPSDDDITLSVGQSYDITWETLPTNGGLTGNLSLYYSTDEGGTYSSAFATPAYSAETYSWTVPADPGALNKVKIEFVYYQQLEDKNDTDFDAGTASQTEVSGTGEDAGIVLTKSVSIGTPVPYAAGSNPLDITFDSATNFIWAANDGTYKINKVDVITGERTEYTLSYNYCAGITFYNVSDSVWVSHKYDNKVSKVNINTGVAVTAYTVGSGPVDLVFDNVTNSIWTANGGGTASKIIIATGEVSSYAAGSNPTGIAFDSPTNSVWVANSSGRSVSKININTGVKTDYPTTHYTPHGAAFETVTNSIWVSMAGSATVCKYNTATGATSDYTSTFNQPYGLDFDPATNSIWVANAGNDTVTRINIGTGECSPYSVGDNPQSIAFDSYTNSIWVANYGSGTVSKIPIVSTYSTSGTFISRPLDAGPESAGTLGTISWDATTASGITSVQFQIAGSDSETTGYTDYLGPDGTTSTYYTTSGETISSALAGKRYFKYKAYLASDTTATPTLNDVAISFTSTGDTISDESDYNFTIGGQPITTASVTPASLVAGVTGNVTVTFTNVSPIPVDGKIVVTFPSTFTLDSGASTAVLNDDITGDLTATANNTAHTVTLTRSNGPSIVTGDTSISITLTNIKNPETTGVTDYYGIKVTTFGDIIIDSTSTITGSTIENGGSGEDNNLTSTNVIPVADSGLYYAGATGDVIVNFTTVNPIPANGKIIVVFPSGFSFATPAATATGLDGTFSVSVTGQTVTLTRSGGTQSAAGAKSITLTNVTNPTPGGDTGTYAIYTATSAYNGSNISTTRIDQHTAVTGDYIIGYLTNASITGANLKAGATVDNTIAFTTVSAVPAGSKVKVTFPEGYDLNGTIAYVSGNAGSSIGSVSGQILTITTGTGINAATAASIVVSGIKNPNLIGATDTYTIQTLTSADVVIDVKAGISANSIIAPTITLLTPSDDDITLSVGQSYNVTWETLPANGGFTGNVSLYYSTDGGSDYSSAFATPAYSAGTYSWTVPAEPGSLTKVKIESVYYQEVGDKDDTGFGEGTDSQTTVSGTGNAAVVTLDQGAGDLDVNQTIISGGHSYSLGLKTDGTVVAVGNNDNNQCNVTGWTDINTVIAGLGHSLGLKIDGTVVAVGNDTSNQCNVTGWTDIKAIACGFYHSIGLKTDGTVVATGSNTSNQCNVTGWTDIKAIAAVWYHSIGLKTDGTVVAVGNNDNNQCNVTVWTDIKAVAAGYMHTLGLKTDGTVVAVGDNSCLQGDVSGWTDIKAIAAGYAYSLGLKTDGTVVATGDNSYGQCNVTGWTDIKAIAAGYGHSLGLKSDGTVVAVGYNSSSQCAVTGWTVIKQPDLTSVYYSSGAFTSRIFDTGGSNSWGSVSWNSTTPSGTTVTIKAHTSNLADMSDVASTWSNALSNGSTLSGTGITGGHQYVQYKAALATTDTSVTPSLDDVTIGFSDTNASDRAISDESDYNFTIGGQPITTASVTPASLVAGVTGNVTVTFTNVSPIPVDGKIVVTFPSTFTLDSGASTAVLNDDITGDLTATANNTAHTVTLTRSNGPSIVTGDTSISITLTNIKNPETTGVTDYYGIKVTTTGDVTVDETTTVAGSTIISAATHHLAISSPDDISAGARAAYTITRYDQYNNLRAVGAETFYLYAVPSGTNSAFYNAATEGTTIIGVNVSDGSSSAQAWYYEEKMGVYTITVSDNSSAPDASAGIADASDSINVKHGAADHLRLKLGESIASPQQVNVQFALPLLEAVDAHGNILNTDYSATAYSGSKTVVFTTDTGEYDAPNATASDVRTAALTFTNGVSATAPIVKLYRSKTAVRLAGKPNDASLPADGEWSNTIVVNPAALYSIEFVQQPTASAIINSALPQQPIVKLLDQYGNETQDIDGNQTSDTIPVYLDPYVWDDGSETYVSASGTLTVTDYPLNASNCRATFSGVKYDKLGTIVLQASAQSINEYSNSIQFNVAETTTILSAAAPITSVDLDSIKDTTDIDTNKISVLSFKIKDDTGGGNDDGAATLIDQIEIDIAGTGGGAENDIAYAEITDGTTILASTAADPSTAVISDSSIVFGPAANANGQGNLTIVGNGAEKEYTVKICMKASVLTAVEGETYTFSVDRTKIHTDTNTSSELALSSKMLAGTGTPILSTGTIKVDVTHIQALTVDGLSSISFETGETGTPIKLQATDINKNLDNNYTVYNLKFKFTGLSSITNEKTGVTWYPKADASNFDTVYKTVDFTAGVSQSMTLKGYKVESGDVSVTAYSSTYVLLSYLCPAGFKLGANVTLPSGAANRIFYFSGRDQTGAVSSKLPDPCVVSIIDLYGNPVPGVTVTFAAVGGNGASMELVNGGASDAGGHASAYLILGSEPGTYSATAAVTGLTGSPVGSPTAEFISTAVLPQGIIKSGGDDQTGVKVMQTLEAFKVKATTGPEGTGSPVENIEVTFAITSKPSNLTVEPVLTQDSPNLTGSTGEAEAVLTFGDKRGTYEVTATSGYDNSTQVFTVVADPEAASQIVLTGPSDVDAGTASQEFVLTVKDTYGNSAPVSASTSFSLTNYIRPAETVQASGKFYTDSACANEITTKIVTLTPASGSDSDEKFSFYYKDDVTNSLRIKATCASDGDAGIADNDVSVLMTVGPAGLDHFTVKSNSASTVTTTAGGGVTLTIRAYDALDNLKTDAGQRDLVFSGAGASPDNTDPTVDGVAAFRTDPVTSVPITFDSSGLATAAFIPYKAGSVVIKATAGSALTADADALTVTVKHEIADHLKFSGSLPTSGITAGQEFSFGTDITLNAVDTYDNICTGADEAAAFTGTKSVSWSISGTQNSPEGNDSDYFIASTYNYATPSPIVFDAGVSTTSLAAKLYYAQSATITASASGVSPATSSSITVAPAVRAKLKFATEPSGACVTSQPLAQQPKISVLDTYGNIASFSGSISLLPFLDTGATPTPATHTLSATGGLTMTAVGGEATFSGVTYNYPENIYLRAKASDENLPVKFSSMITFTTAAEISTSAGTLVEATSISSLANSARTSVLDFKITDGGADGFDVNITQILVKRSIYDASTNPQGDTSGGWGTYIKEAYIEGDDGSEMIGLISNDQIIFPTANSVLNNSSKTFTLKIILKNPLPSPTTVDGTILAFTITPSADITITSTSSRFSDSTAYSASPKLEVTATNFKITGSNTMNAGSSQLITLTAVDSLGNTDRDFTGAGAKTLVFSGASPASQEGYNPTASVAGGAPIDFGTNTGVVFTDGQNSSTVSITLYKAETANIKAVCSLSSLTTPNENALAIVVSGGDATSLTWSVEPVTVAVENAPWKEFSVSISDIYGNVSSSSTEVTITPSNGTVSDGAIAEVAAQSGVATFYNFAVEGLDNGEVITVSAGADSVIESGASDPITVYKEYDITVNVKDYTSSSNLTECTLDVTSGGVRAGEAGVFPKSGNSPFTFKLPYGEYVLTVSKEKYVDENTTKTAGAAADYLDGTYDAKIAWTITATSLTEATADYTVMSSFVYNEDTNDLYVRLWLDRRGKLVLNDDINILGPGKVDIYDDATGSWFTSLTLDPPDSDDLVNGTYMVEVTGALSASNLLGKALVSGKTYFAKCQINYGGLTGTGSLYEGATTFTVTNIQKVGTEIISKIGLAEGETLAGKIANVQTAVTAISGQTVTMSGKVDTMSGQVTSVSGGVSDIITKTNSIQSSAAAILEDVETTLPAKVVAELEKGVMSEILTRNTVLRVDDSVKIRYRTASGLSPTLTIYRPDGIILADYDGVNMDEISDTGIYEYEVTAKESWGTGDFTVECAESTKKSKDSMILTIKALYVAGAGVEESIDAVGEAVTKVYTRQKGIEDLLGNSTDIKKTTTIFGKVNGLNSTIDSLNLTTVSTDAKNARMNAQNVYNEIENLKKSMGDMQGQAGMLKELSSQLEEMKSNLGKVSQSVSAVTTTSTVGTPAVTALSEPESTTIITTSPAASTGGGATTIITSTTAPASTEESGSIVLPGSPGASRPSAYAKNYAPGTYRTKVSVSEGAVTVAEYDSGGSIYGTERRVYDGQNTVMIATIGPAKETGLVGTGDGTGAGAREADMKNLANRVEELTALVKVLTRMIETTNNKPIVEGWFEQG
ncbi:MAG: hypothetical protein V1682_03410 [Candidatus Omnitrophota bacterium]